MQAPLIAHHFAAHHFVILASFFSIGLWFGWQVAGALLRRVN